MDNQTLIFDRILRGDLRPWLDSDSDEKFASLSGDIKTTEPRFQTLYDFDFYRCFNCKTKYYRKLIINESNAYCNRIIEQISSGADTYRKGYLSEVVKKLEDLLGETNYLIHTYCFELKDIDPYTADFVSGRGYKTDTYIIQLLKTALLKVYLEIQEAFKSLIPNEEFMEIEDLYLQVLFEAIPEQIFLKRHTILKIPNTAESSAKASKLKSFKFERLATNPGALTDSMDSLKRYRFIDKRSSATDFKRIFSGQEIKNPIRWTGNDSEFHWFIHLLYTEYKFVEDVRQQQWKVAEQCFIRPDGTHFDVSKLRYLKRPRRTSDLIERAVRLMK